MKSTVEITNSPIDFSKTILITITNEDLARYEHNNFVQIAKESYEEEKTISNLLWYLSELFKAFEDLGVSSKAKKGQQP